MAYLLRLLALHRRFYLFISTVTHISGDTNYMADDASRLWNLSDTALLTQFNSNYPQARYWKLTALRPRMHSTLISSLYKRRSTKGLFPQEPEQTNAASGNGKSSAETTISTHALIKYRTRSRFSKFLPARLEAAYLLPMGSQYAHVLLRSNSGLLGRRSPTWVLKTPFSTSTG